MPAEPFFVLNVRLLGVIRVGVVKRIGRHITVKKQHVPIASLQVYENWLPTMR